MVSIYALGHISGAHFNPAVTAGFAIGRHFPLARVMPYWFAQVAGALVASSFPAALARVGPRGRHPAGGFGHSEFRVGGGAHLHPGDRDRVGRDRRPGGSGHAAAISIGGAVALRSLVGGPVSGASMNPARSLGPALVSGNLQTCGST
jgi:glycerol uptake facilitator-like aquaporin